MRRTDRINRNRDDQHQINRDDATIATGAGRARSRRDRSLIAATELLPFFGLLLSRFVASVASSR